MWEEIEKEKAKQRQMSGLKNQNIAKANVPQREEGTTRGIIAEKANIGSGRKLKNYIFIIKLINTKQ